MAKDDGKGQPGAETKAFSPSDHTIHCVAKLGEAKDGTKVTFAWWNVDKNEKIKDLDYTTKGAENIVHEFSSAASRIGSGLCNGSSKSGSFVSHKCGGT